MSNEQCEAWGGDFSEVTWLLNARHIWKVSPVDTLTFADDNFAVMILNTGIFYGLGVVISKSRGGPPGLGQASVLMCRRRR